MLRRTAITIMLFGCVICTSVGLIYLKISPLLPSPEFLKDYACPEISRVYDKHYRLIHEYVSIKRINVPFEKIPKKLIAAFLVAEDKNFYYHNVLDPFRIAKAITQNIWHKKSGQSLIGASTITQQVAKNFVVGSEKSFLRKIKEAFVTFNIEYYLSKDRILELYLNQIYLGGGTYGIQAASINFFGKSIQEISLSQICLLAALPKAPTYFIDHKNIESLKKRRNLIITSLLTQGYINDIDAKQALNSNIDFTQNKLDDLNYGYYLTPLKEQITTEISKTILTQGFEIISCMDINCQNAAQNALRKGLVNFENKIKNFNSAIVSLGENYSLKQLQQLKLPFTENDMQKAIAYQKNNIWYVVTEKDQHFKLNCSEWNFKTSLKTGDVILVKIKNKTASFKQIPKVSGAIVVMEAKAGKVLAITGGWDSNFFPFSCATQAARQPGSSFKPFAYLAALENGTKPSDILTDEKFSIKIDNNNIYHPKNVDGKYHSAVTVKTSLAHSYNLAAIDLALKVGIEPIKDTAELFGIYNKSQQHLSIVLGAQETTLLKLTTAYAMLFNGGYYVIPRFYSACTNRFGKSNQTINKTNCNIEQISKITQTGIIKNSQKIASSQAVFELLEMLRSVVTKVTARKLLPLEHKYGITIHGKTGTSNNNLDAWFVGSVSIPGTIYQGNNPIVIGVFVGYLKPESLGKGNGGGAVALPIFSNFLENFISDILQT